MSREPITYDAFEDYILQASSAHQPSPTSPLAPAFQLLRQELELSKKSKYREELHFHIKLINAMLRTFQLTSLDITQKSVIALTKKVQNFEENIATAKDKNAFHAQFRTDIGLMTSQYISKAEEQIRILKLHQPTGYQLAILKLEKLIDQARIINTTTFLPPTTDQETTQLTRELYTGIRKLQIMAETHASELALPYGLDTDKTIDKFKAITAEFHLNKNHKNFLDKILNTANEFKSQVEKLLADLKGERHEKTRQQYRELVKVVNKITEIAKNQKDPKLVSKLEDQIALLNTIAADPVLIPTYGEEKITPEQQFTDFLKEKLTSLPALDDDKEHTKTLTGALIGVAGSVVGANAVLGNITNALDLIFNAASMADSAEGDSVLNFIKANAHDIVMLCGSAASLVTALVVCPPAVPFILQAMGAYSSVKDIVSTAQELPNSSAIDQACSIGGKFMKIAKEYMDMKLAAAIEEQVIPLEWSDSKPLEKKKDQRDEKEAENISGFFYGGRSRYIHSEIKTLIGMLDALGDRNHNKSKDYNGKQLFDHLLNNRNNHYIALIPLYRKLGGTPDTLANFLFHLITDDPKVLLQKIINSLEQTLSGEKIDPKIIRNFAKTLSTGIAHDDRISDVATLTRTR